MRRWWCTKCDTYRPCGTHHCSMCRRCVLNMDHHCPWVNNCIGIRNHKYFLLLLFYAWCACVWSILLMLMILLQPSILAPTLLDSVDRGIVWGFSQRRLTVQMEFIVGIAILVLLMIFLSLTSYDELEFLLNGEGIVDRKQRAAKDTPATRPQKAVSYTEKLKSILQTLRRLMGSESTFWWLLPTQPLVSYEPLDQDPILDPVLARLEKETTSELPGTVRSNSRCDVDLRSRAVSGNT